MQGIAKPVSVYALASGPWLAMVCVSLVFICHMSLIGP